MKRVALATCRKFSQLTADDQALAARLLEQGVDARALVWNDPDQRVGDATSVIIRSCWDYHFSPREFLRWLDGLEHRGIRVHNPARTIRWNHDKTYLHQCEAAGLLIPPTASFEAGIHANLADLMQQREWTRAVVKPTVSATSWQTSLVSREEAVDFQPIFEALLRAGGVMVQRFIPEVQEQGEWSFIFFSRRFSHAVLKRAKSGDFRVQEQFGGVVHWDAAPPAGLIAQAEAVIGLVEGPLLFARVDGVEIEGRLYLMELELIEPALFLQAPQATERFAQAIVSTAC